MGNILTTKNILENKKLNVDLYKWSSAEFRKEYALIYTSLDNEFEGASIFRLSVNPDRVICRVADCFNNHPKRFHMEITAETDKTTGDCRFREVKVVSDGTSNEHRHPQMDSVSFSYGDGDHRPLSDYEVSRYDKNIGPENFKKINWEVCLSYAINLRKSLKSIAIIQCDEVKGLSAMFIGPYKYKGLVSLYEKPVDPHDPREIKGEPPKEYKALVETEFRGQAYTLFPRGRGNIPFPVSVLATGLINNIGVENKGNCNGSIFYNCEIYRSPSP